MKKIKTGLAAFGMSGQIFHAPFISTNPQFELTAITERSKELSKERYPSARIVRSFDELIALDELELIVVNHCRRGRKTNRIGKSQRIVIKCVSKQTMGFRFFNGQRDTKQWSVRSTS